MRVRTPRSGQKAKGWSDVFAGVRRGFASLRLKGAYTGTTPAYSVEAVR